MSGSEVRLRSGQRWSAQHFVDHYKLPTASGTPTPVAGPPEPVDVDMSWYMGEGPGRYYHPGMFPIVHQILDNRNLAPGAYDLEKLAADKEALKSGLSNYRLDTQLLGLSITRTRVWERKREDLRTSHRQQGWLQDFQEN